MPYAAKATIEHEYVAGVLNIWLTFALPMNQLVKPLDTVWLIRLDTFLTAVTSSVWIDAHTMQLVITGLPARPVRVTVAFDGPDSLLETTWKKNWEPWGAILSIDLTANLMPVGMILFWYGSIATIPSGWAICDGTNGTPNLFQRFVTGAGPTFAPGTIGGFTSHTHIATQPAHTHFISGGTFFQEGTGFADETDGTTPSITVQTSNHVPPYMALCYIMKL